MTITETYRPSHKEKPLCWPEQDDMGLCAEERMLASNVSTEDFKERYQNTRCKNDKI